MASSHVGGLSGAFIPVSEDAGMIDAARTGCLKLEKLEAMTAVCSVGLDMIVCPGDTPAEVIAAIIADEAAIGMVNSKLRQCALFRPSAKKRERNWNSAACWAAAGHAGQPGESRKIYPPRRSDSGAAAEFKKLKRSEQTIAAKKSSAVGKPMGRIF